MAELVPNRARPLVNAGIFLTTLPFAGFGALFAQLFIANTKQSWRWNYYLSIITCGLSLILFAFCYFPPGWETKHKGQNRIEGLKKFDYIGFLLYAGGLILVLLGLCKLRLRSLGHRCTNWSIQSLGWYLTCVELGARYLRPGCRFRRPRCIRALR